MRLRKAFAVRWEGRDEPGFYFAENATKARVAAYNDIRNFDDDVELTELKVSRVPQLDVELPDEHRLVSELSNDERHIISHAYGCNYYGLGYRTHYCANPFDTSLSRLAHEFGLMESPRVENEEGSTPGYAGRMYFLTKLGEEVAKSMLPTYPPDGQSWHPDARSVENYLAARKAEIYRAAEARRAAKEAEAQAADTAEQPSLQM